MPPLRELQQRFAAAILGNDDAALPIGLFSTDDAAARVSVYRNNVLSNYRNALAASYPVVCRLVGKAFFDAAVDAFVRARPSTSGDLNVFGGDFGDFLASYPYAEGLSWLADVARLEWAIDEAHRAVEVPCLPEALLAGFAMVAAERLASLRLRLDPSCRLVASPYPILHVWRANQPDRDGREHVRLDEGADLVLVRRDDVGVAVEPLEAAEYAWLAALADDESLGAAIEAAQRADAQFDLGSALRAHIAAGTLAGIVRTT
jgi:hypothetical protein